ncbi:hypothetical protein AB9K41_17020 [Cribrihabitans sp. XS_ASV171]
MTKENEATIPRDEARIDDTLRQQLDAIAREDTPERLLVLARELQRLLREGMD